MNAVKILHKDRLEIELLPNVVMSVVFPETGNERVDTDNITKWDTIERTVLSTGKCIIENDKYVYIFAADLYTLYHVCGKHMVESYE